MIRIPLDMTETGCRQLAEAVRAVKTNHVQLSNVHDARFILSGYLDQVADIGAQLLAAGVYDKQELAGQLADTIAEALTREVKTPEVTRVDETGRRIVNG